jgi:NAD(P)-dependent dehydrogenase (short-subunit alcohol dehydrogenase family)
VVGQTWSVPAPPTEQRRSLAVVTGASRGFGLEVARALSAAGWGVITISRQGSAQLDEMPPITQIHGDITSMDLAGLTSAVGDRAVDLLVNNAGVGGTGMRLASLEPDELERAFSVHVLGPARLSMALLPHLVRSANPLIINVSSRLASLSRQASGLYQDVPTSYAYRISKAAQNMLSVCMAMEPGSSLRVWALHPGRLRTAMGLPDADGDPAHAAQRLVGLLQADAATGARLAYLALDEGPLPW